MNEMIMDWDSVIESDGNSSFITLEPGDYNFTITKFERATYPGSEKIPPCSKAVLGLHVETPNGNTTVFTDLILYKSLEWKIASFFRCIGQKKHGEPLVPNWNAVLGASGRAKFKTRTYTASNGSEKTTNDVDSFYDYDPKFFSTASAQTPPQAAAKPESYDFPF